MWPPRERPRIEIADLYRGLAGQGYEYGPVFQGLRAAWRRGDEVFAEVELAASAQPAGDAFGLHPALLDAALHASLAVRPAEPGRLLLPFSWRDVSLWTTGAAALRVRLAPADGAEMSVTVADHTGQLVASVGSLALRPADAERLSAGLDETGLAGGHLLSLEWTPMLVPAASVDHVAVLGGDHLFLAAALRGTMPRVDSHPDVGGLCAAIDAGAPVPALVFAGLGAGAIVAADVALAARSAAHQALALVQAWLADERLAGARLVVVTCGAVAAGPAEDVPDLAYAPVWGLLRSAQTEHPDRFVLLDVDGADSSYAVLAAAVASGEPQLAIRDGVARAPRLVPLGHDATGEDQTLAPPPHAMAWRLDITARGTLTNLSLAPCPEALAPLDAGQVRVAVRAAGVNFRDVLGALGRYPGDPGPLGLEGAGVVCEVGPRVTSLAVGDRVMGLFPRAFGPFAVADRRTIVPVPAGWSWAEAGGACVALLTAYHALVRVAGLSAGESVLVHAGAGGVGMAAVALARHLGAEVYATASPDKWPALRALGVDDKHLRVLTDTGVRGPFPDGDRRPWRRRGAGQPGRRLCGRVAAAAAGRRSFCGAGQGGRARRGRRRAGASGRRLPRVRPAGDRPRPPR